MSVSKHYEYTKTGSFDDCANIFGGGLSDVLGIFFSN